MVDTPKQDDEEERKDTPKACSLKKQSKRWRHPKSRLARNNDHIDPALEQGEPLPDHGNMENQAEQPNPVEDNSPDDITPDRHPEQ